MKIYWNNAFLDEMVRFGTTKPFKRDIKLCWAGLVGSHAYCNVTNLTSTFFVSKPKLRFHLLWYRTSRVHFPNRKQANFARFSSPKVPRESHDMKMRPSPESYAISNANTMPIPVYYR